MLISTGGVIRGYSPRRREGSQDYSQWYQRWPAPAGPLGDPEDALRNLHDSFEEIELLDRLGFDWVSLSEHHYNMAVMSAVPMVVGANVAARLRHAKVAMIGPVMPLNNPVRVAEEIATLDHLSEGRLVVGFLRGIPQEFQVYTVDPSETRDRTTEGMELVLKCLTEPEPFSWEGRYYQFRTISVSPRPLQQPHPPFYVLGNSPESCEFAAKHHLGFGMAFGTFAINGRSGSYYRQRCAAYGWKPKPEQIIYRGGAYLAETDKEAEEYLETLRESDRVRAGSAVWDAIIKADPNPFHDGGAPIPGRDDNPKEPVWRGGALLPTFCGTPETIIQQVKQCKEETGAGVIDLLFQRQGYSNARAVRMLEMFAAKVMPEIRDL